MTPAANGIAVGPPNPLHISENARPLGPALAWSAELPPAGGGGLIARAILTDAERLAWECLPDDPDPDPIAAFFTLADGEVDALSRLPTPAARLATAIALAARDVHHVNLFDRIEAKTGIEPFGWLVG